MNTKFFHVGVEGGYLLPFLFSRLALIIVSFSKKYQSSREKPKLAQLEIPI